MIEHIWSQMRTVYTDWIVIGREEKTVLRFLLFDEQFVRSSFVNAVLCLCYENMNIYDNILYLKCVLGMQQY